MIPRFTLFFLCLAFTQLAHAQLVVEQVVEVIESTPDETTRDWVIGGRKLATNAQTLVADQYPATVGNLAAVQYVVRDGESTALQILPLPFSATGVSDGPHVFWTGALTAEIITFADGKTQRITEQFPDGPRTFEKLSSLETSITLDPRPPVIPPGTWEASSRLLAISDLEGNYLNALRFLQNNKILDAEGHWDWGDGHLVLIGDLVDRGSQVTELMWLVRRLEREAAAAGGHVHYVLGNHEAMVMAGDLRYVHPRYLFVAGRIGQGYDELYGPTSEIGRWWRTRHGVLKIGDLLFVHGGYSPKLDRANLDIDTLNQRIRDGLHPAQPEGLTADINPVGHMHGPFWYRGYFEQHAAEWGGKATPAEIDRILQRHEVRHIVIGHTLVDQVGPLDEDGTVIAIDTQWRTADRCQGLLHEDGRFWRLTMTGDRQEILEPVER